MKKLLIACECNGEVREAFREKGWDAWSCDFSPCWKREGKDKHYIGDVKDIINERWDMMIAFPPCTYLASSGLHWTRRGYRDEKLTEEAIAFVKFLWRAKIERICIENPVGHISMRLRDPHQIVQPYYFGHPESKRTCLWLKNLAPLQFTNVLKKPQGGWLNTDDNGQNVHWGNAHQRSKTYPGIAKAMAEQWT